MRDIALAYADQFGLTPMDIDDMVRAFDAACDRAMIPLRRTDDRNAMANALLAAYVAGERRKPELIEVALKALYPDAGTRGRRRR